MEQNSEEHKEQEPETKVEKYDTDEVLPDELSDALEEMSPEVRKHVEKFMISSVQMGGVVKSENAISKKITEEHITAYLNGSKEQMLEAYKEEHEDKIFKAIILFIVLAFIVVVILLLKNTPDIMEKVLYTLGGLLGGALGGYGYGKSKRDDD